MAQKRAELKAPHNRQVTEEALLKDCLAREAFEELTEKRGVKKSKLISLLSRIPYASNKALPLINEMRDRRVRALPDRIRGWADTIEKVNASPWLTPDNLPKRASVVRHPEHWPKPLNRILIPEWAEPAAKRLLGVPGTLHFYADFLGAWLQMFHPVGKRRRDLGLGNRIQLKKYLILKLVRLVRDSAQGRPCYKEIATLLNAAYELTGKARTISEDDLSKLETNNPWLSLIVRDFPDRI